MPESLTAERQTLGQVRMPALQVLMFGPLTPRPETPQARTTVLQVRKMLMSEVLMSTDRAMIYLWIREMLLARATLCLLIFLALPPLFL
jgi:hypothetical protein